MTLAGVLQGVRLRSELAREWSELRVAGLEYDSRKVEKDTLFLRFKEHASTDANSRGKRWLGVRAQW